MANPSVDPLSAILPEDSWFIFDENVEYFGDLRLVRRVIEKTKERKPYRGHLDKWKNYIIDSSNEDTYDDLCAMVLFIQSDRQYWHYGFSTSSFDG